MTNEHKIRIMLKKNEDWRIIKRGMFVIIFSVISFILLAYYAA